MNNQWEHQLHLVQFIPVGQGTFLVFAVEDIEMGACRVPIHHQTGTDIGGRGRLMGTNQFYRQGVPQVPQLPAPRLCSMLQELRKPQANKASFPPAATLPVWGQIAPLWCTSWHAVVSRTWGRRWLAGTVDCWASCGASRYAENNSPFSTPVKVGAAIPGLITHIHKI